MLLIVTVLYINKIERYNHHPGKYESMKYLVLSIQNHNYKDLIQ